MPSLHMPQLTFTEEKIYDLHIRCCGGFPECTSSCISSFLYNTPTQKKHELELFVLVGRLLFFVVLTTALLLSSQVKVQRSKQNRNICIHNCTASTQVAKLVAFFFNILFIKKVQIHNSLIWMCITYANNISNQQNKPSILLLTNAKGFCHETQKQNTTTECLEIK